MNDEPEQQHNSELAPSPSPEEQRAKQKAASDQKLISGCAFVGAATLFVLNLRRFRKPTGSVADHTNLSTFHLSEFSLSALRFCSPHRFFADAKKGRANRIILTPNCFLNSLDAAHPLVSVRARIHQITDPGLCDRKKHMPLFSVAVLDG